MLNKLKKLKNPDISRIYNYKIPNYYNNKTFFLHGGRETQLEPRPRRSQTVSR